MEKDASSTESLLECYLRELGCFAQGCGEVGWQKAKEIYTEALSALAKKYPPASGSVINLFEGKQFASFQGGDEHMIVHLPSREKKDTIYKITYGDNFGCGVMHDHIDENYTGVHFCAYGNDNPWFYLKRWQLLNSISEYQTQCEGILEPEREGGLPRICMSQPYIKGDAPASDDLREAFERFQFFKVSEGAFYNEHRNILLTDAYPRNVRLWDGAPIPFDAIASNPDASIQQWLKNRLDGKRCL